MLTLEKYSVVIFALIVLAPRLNIPLKQGKIYMRAANPFMFMKFLIALAIFGNALAHEGVERAAENDNIQARLFTADAANGDVVAVDLPGGETMMRLSTPPYMIYLAQGGNGQYVYAMRGRNTDRDWVTVIETGFTPGIDTVRPPNIARSFVGNVPDGVQHGHTATVKGKDAIIMEGDAELIIFDNPDFSGFGEISVRRFPLSAVDHLHFLEAGDHLYIGHLGHGYVQVLNSQTGAEVARIEGCPVLHGKTAERISGRLFFGCQPHVLVVGTSGEETHQVVARIRYPNNQRVGNFYDGKGQVIWGYTEGALPMIYRLDAGREPLAFDTLEVPRSVRQGTSADGEFLFILTYDGTLEVRDGGGGGIIHSLKVSGPFAADIEEKIDRAVMPDIKTWRDHAFISLPHEGRIVEIDVPAGEIVRYIATGGEPTRVTIVSTDDHGHSDHDTESQHDKDHANNANHEHDG